MSDEGGRTFDVYKVMNSIDAVKYNMNSDMALTLTDVEIMDIAEKTEDLYADLEAAFKEKGITVQINKETGEIAIDSSVIFGGDSAELSDAGKEMLKNYAEAYLSIISDEKYEGFIEKTMVEGHTAPVGGTIEEGMPLSKQRADNVCNYCKDGAGVDLSGAVFEAVGYSCSRPIYNTDGSVNMDASRRVSFRFIISADA